MNLCHLKFSSTVLIGGDFGETGPKKVEKRIY